MSELKKEFRWFNIMEYEKEENYLSKRHQEGWKFKRVTFPGVYTFERCEPEKVIYQLDYNKEGIKHQMEYVRMFEDCGWEYLTEFDGYNYFRKPADKMQQEEEIFCDDISRLDMMNRIFIGRVIPLIVILCGLIWQFYISATEQDRKPRGQFPCRMILPQVGCDDLFHLFCNAHLRFCKIGADLGRRDFLLRHQQRKQRQGIDLHLHYSKGHRLMIQ